MPKHKESEWFRKRARRIERVCTREVIESISKGYISASWVDKTFRKLSPEEQRARIAEIVTRQERCRTIVELLKAHMEAGTSDLHQLRTDLAKALCSAEALR
jgi:hypothetical protein